MRSKYGTLAMQVHDRYRTIPEARIIEMLALMGWAYQLDASAAASSKRALQTWVEMGLGFRRGAGGERCFDPVEVNNMMKRAGCDAGDSFFAKYVATQRRLVSDLASAGSSTFIVEFRRTFSLRKVPKGARLRLRAPLPLTGDHLDELEVIPFVEAAEDVRIDRSPGRLEVRTLASGEAEVCLGARMRFVARDQQPRPALSTDGDLTAYLAEREELIVVSDRIRALALSLLAPGAQPFEAVRAFWEYINGELMCGAVHYDQIDATLPCDWILDAGWFDCRLGSSLFVALCRARGIPARVLGGYTLYSRAPAIHYWAEVWIDQQGWTPFDLFGWDLSFGGRDRDWLDTFFGRLDQRLTTQRLPKEFTGAPGVAIPPAWHLVSVARAAAIEFNLLDIDGTPVYADTIQVTANGS